MLDAVSTYIIILFWFIAAFCFVYTMLGLEPLWLWFFGVVSVIIWGPLLGIAWTCAFLRESSLTRRSRFAAIALPIAIVTMVLWYWPMWIPFWLHKGALDRIADQFEAGTLQSPPASVGLYPVLQVRTCNGSTGIQTGGWAGGGPYLVRTTKLTTRGHVWCNTNWEFYLGDDWYYVYED